MNDAQKIFALYLETAEEQPQMTQYAGGSKQWRLHGQLHRRDGPAVELKNGYKAWYLHDALHREGAPAIEWEDGTKEWFLHNKLHRADGPAVEWADGTKMWYLHGKRFADAEAWAEAALKRKNKPHDAAAIDAFLRPILKKNIAL